MPLSEIAKSMREDLVAEFHVPKEQVHIIRAPYRICPLGAHVDHQGGSVTAMAIDRGVLLAYAPVAGPEVTMISREFPGRVAFSLDQVPPKITGDWGNFPRGAVHALQKRFELKNGIVAISSGRLDGGGLSSSAAFGLACLQALEDVNQIRVSASENIQFHSDIENEYLGLRIGILDQSAILLSRARQLTQIDCATMEYERYPGASVAPAFRILIAFSGVKQALTATGYNQRVDECRSAARILLEASGRRDILPVLGNVSRGEYERYRHHLSNESGRRAEHFFSEQDRVHRGIQAWCHGDLATFGQLMTESGWSSIRNYECGAPPLIELFEILLDTPGVLGTRFSGAGFRGCCVAFVHDELAEEACQTVMDRYSRARPELARDAQGFLCDSSNGIERLR